MRTGIHSLPLLLVFSLACGSPAEFKGQTRTSSPAATTQAIGDEVDTPTEKPTGRSADATAGPGPASAHEPSEELAGDPLPSDDGPLEPQDGLDLVEWHFACAGTTADSSSGLEASGTHSETIVGGGAHSLDPDTVDGSDLIFTGELCPPESLARDIVFVVDVSGSMRGLFRGNDNPRGGSCGRLAAVQQVTSALATDPDTRFGIVTFASDLEATSSRLWPGGAGLYSDIVTAGDGGDLEDVLCAGRNDTNYDAGLNAAGQLFQLFGRTDATKEIYFISDGEPTDGASGRFVAESLRRAGTTIATIMLRGDDTVLREQIASRDQNGLPIHTKVDTAALIADALAGLTTNQIVASVLSYRAIGASGWQSIDLSPHLNGLTFAIPGFALRVDDWADGIEVNYWYKDLHAREYETRGTLTWTVSNRAHGGDAP